MRTSSGLSAKLNFSYIAWDLSPWVYGSAIWKSSCSLANHSSGCVYDPIAASTKSNHLCPTSTRSAILVLPSKASLSFGRQLSSPIDSLINTALWRYLSSLHKTLLFTFTSFILGSFDDALHSILIDGPDQFVVPVDTFSIIGCLKSTSQSIHLTFNLYQTLLRNIDLHLLLSSLYHQTYFTHRHRTAFNHYNFTQLSTFYSTIPPPWRSLPSSLPPSWVLHQLQLLRCRLLKPPLSPMLVKSTVSKSRAYPFPPSHANAAPYSGFCYRPGEPCTKFKRAAEAVAEALAAASADPEPGKLSSHTLLVIIFYSHFLSLNKEQAYVLFRSSSSSSLLLPPRRTLHQSQALSRWAQCCISGALSVPQWPTSPNSLAWTLSVINGGTNHTFFRFATSSTGIPMAFGSAIYDLSRLTSAHAIYTIS